MKTVSCILLLMLLSGCATQRYVEQHSKIKKILGMNQKEAIARWGLPSKMDTWGIRERWIYSDQFPMVYIYFENGKITGWEIDKRWDDPK